MGTRSRGDNWRPQAWERLNTRAKEGVVGNVVDGFDLLLLKEKHGDNLQAFGAERDEFAPDLDAKDAGRYMQVTRNFALCNILHNGEDVAKEKEAVQRYGWTILYWVCSDASHNDTLTETWKLAKAGTKVTMKVAEEVHAELVRLDKLGISPTDVEVWQAAWADTDKVLFNMDHVRMYGYETTLMHFYSAYATNEQLEAQTKKDK